MTVRETGAAIDAAAATWAARLDRGLDAAEQAELAAWSAADVRRAGALARAMAVLARADELAAPPRVRALGRRELLWGGGAMAAGLAAAVTAPLVMSGASGLATGPGERRVARLADGTRVILNADTRLRASVRGARREVVLERGEAVFEVAAQGGRPFLVQARGMDVTTASGAFAVRVADGERRQVLVRRGPVEARCPGHPSAELVTGCWATARDNGEIVIDHVGTARIAAALAWSEKV